MSGAPGVLEDSCYIKRTDAGRRLAIDGNEDALPLGLMNLQLEELHLEDNPLLGLPESLLKESPREILRYYFESRAGDGRPRLDAAQPHRLEAEGEPA